MMSDDSCNLSVRVLRSLVERLDTLVPALSDDPRMQVLGKVSRSDVARAAMVRGLEELEREYQRAQAAAQNTAMVA